MLEILLLVVNGLYGFRMPLENKIDPRCYEKEYIRAWVYFTDKSIDTDDYNRIIKTVTSRMNRSALVRRRLRAGIVDYADIPIYEDYIEEIEKRGGLLLHRSKWVNAASFWIYKDDLKRIAQLDFVYKIIPVASFAMPIEAEIAVQDTEIYGLSYRQLKMFNIDQVQDLGITGAGVKVGILDTGLRRRHTALSDIDVIAEYDFLGGDQVFFGDIAVTPKYGVYCDILFYKTGSRFNIFLTGDTIRLNMPVRDILYTYSTDNGNTWQPLEKLTDNYSNWADQLSICGKDTLFVFYRDRYGLKYMVFADTILVPSMPLIDGSYFEPGAIQSGDTVYVVFHSRNTLYLKKGDISGFSSEVAIDSSPATIKNSVTIPGTGKMGVFYSTAPDDSLFFLASSLPDTTFSRRFIASAKTPTAITSGDTILLAYKDMSQRPVLTIAFRRSDDFGNIFNNPIDLSGEIPSAGKISIEKSGSEVVVAWESQGKIYFRTSNNNGTDFGPLDSLNKEFVYLPTLANTGAGITKIYALRGDTITDDAPNDPQYWHPRHGTEMLGLIGGYFRDRYIGVAPGVQFLIAKTENPDSNYEYPIEEDTWIAGLEWLESQGADIVNSSLGYSDWYNWPQDFDGHTSPASIAADEATKRGMIIVNASGNVAVPRIVIPGDAEGIITVGGIDSLYLRWQYSGYFPTDDHTKKKPDLVCLSAAPVVIDPDSTDSYLYSFGTSGATAMVSGICALLLEAHPDWNVDSVKNALFSTASYVDSPSDSLGYGWPDAYQAAQFHEAPSETLKGNIFLKPYPNPFIPDRDGYVYIPFKLTEKTAVEIRLYSLSGRLIKKDEREGLLMPGRYEDKNPQSLKAAFIWDGRDEDGQDVGSGIYYCLLLTYGSGNDIVKIALIR